MQDVSEIPGGMESRKAVGVKESVGVNVTMTMLKPFEQVVQERKGRWIPGGHGEQKGCWVQRVCRGQCYYDNAQHFLGRLCKMERVDTWRAWRAKRPSRSEA